MWFDLWIDLWTFGDVSNTDIDLSVVSSVDLVTPLNKISEVGLSYIAVKIKTCQLARN